jgi:hypothetical protein
MATPDAYPEEAGLPATVRNSRPIEHHGGVIRRWRERTAERKRARLISVRSRRTMARMLRAIAKDANDRDPVRSRNDVLLRYRAAAVQGDLLQIAALLEHADDADPECIAALHDLLRDGISPLYNPAVHASELQYTLDYVRASLTRDHTLGVGIQLGAPERVHASRRAV